MVYRKECIMNIFWFLDDDLQQALSNFLETMGLNTLGIGLSYMEQSTVVL